MLILAIDTSRNEGSVCLASGDSSVCRVIGTANVTGGMFSAQLVPVIAKLMAGCGVSKTDLTGIAAAAGPGSFTGLRIGLAAVKGIAETLNIPIAAVTTLEAIAASASSTEEDTLAVLDAGRNEFYLRHANPDGAKEFLATRDELISFLQQHPRAFVVSTGSAVESMEEFASQVECVTQPGAEMIARIGLRKLERGEVVTVNELDANYVRRDEGLFTTAK